MLMHIVTQTATGLAKQDRTQRSIISCQWMPRVVTRNGWRRVRCSWDQHITRDTRFTASLYIFDCVLILIQNWCQNLVGVSQEILYGLQNILHSTGT